MLNITYEEFCRLCATADMVPVCREFLADLETPVSILRNFSRDENVFLLESIEGGERFGRYSFLGVNPRGLFTVENHRAFFRKSGGEKQELPFERTPLSALKKLLGGKKIALAETLPPLFGGAVGFLGYEAVCDFEELPEPKTTPDTPEAAFLLTDEMIVFDNVRHTVKIIITLRSGDFSTPRAAYDHALERIAGLEKKIHAPAPESPLPPVAAATEDTDSLQSNMTRGEFCGMVRRGQQEIRAGEVIQLVLSQRFTKPLRTDPLRLYRALRFVNPSPYTFFLKLGGIILIGSSPETMVKLEGSRATLRPIAGTRPRGKTEQMDRKLADELLTDEKECAEHLMLVDLGRNDLGRVARPGSVQVSSFMNVERYSHVMHLVSSVESELDEKYDAFDLVGSVFPAGTLSGAPKIRAMELIHELEKTPRGVYGGAVGYFSCNGNLDLAITIRTMKIQNGEMSIQAGAGIVFDSVPEREYEETLQKARALFQAASLAENSLEDLVLNSEKQ